MTCRFYGRCPRDRDTGEVLCHYGWRDDCPMDADDGGDYDEHADLDDAADDAEEAAMAEVDSRT